LLEGAWQHSNQRLNLSPELAVFFGVGMHFSAPSPAGLPLRWFFRFSAMSAQWPPEVVGNTCASSSFIDYDGN
jgi:hypothetical protein